jgi:glutamate N-acetyltransferase/amino-acid N-acetyltransferase
VQVPGFRFAGVRAGLKTRGPDVALIVADRPMVAAGVFTTNRACAAPVRITRDRIASGRARAVLVHAGNANACTGAHGRRTVEVSDGARRTRARRARRRTCSACATGKIGVPRAARAPACPASTARSPRSTRAAFPIPARAICTTDAFPKTGGPEAPRRRA